MSLRRLVSDAITGSFPDKCIAAKRKAAGKLARTELRCHSKAAKNDSALDAECIGKAVDKFNAAVAKAEKNGACADGGSPQALVEDSCVASAVVVDAGTVTGACPDPDCGPVEDGDNCTDDACVSGTVTHTPVNVDDSDACTADSCDSGSGDVTHTPVSVDDADACTTDACDSGTGEVSHTPVSIDDGDACTPDSCDPATGEVSHSPAPIDDGNACTTVSCDPGDGMTIGSVAHQPIPIDDGNPCTVDSCDPITGEVTHINSGDDICIGF